MTSPALGVLTIALPLLVGGCKGDPPRVPRRARAQRRGDAGVKVSPEKLGVDADHTLDALTQGYARLRAALGAHELSMTSTLSASLDKKQTRTVKQTVRIHADNKGNFAASKNTHRQYGFEVRWVEGWLYVGRRYNRMVKRRPQRRDEPRRLVERIYGLLPAYLDLLEPFVAVKRLGSRDHLGRRVVEVALSLAAKPRPPGEPDRAPARKWRRKISVEKLEGRALIDGSSGVPLRVDLQAVWTFVPPKSGSRAYASGIPDAFGSGLGRMTLVFAQHIDKLGSGVALVDPPPATRVARDIRRLRLEAERQIAVGERDMPKHWQRVFPNVDGPHPKRARAKKTTKTKKKKKKNKKTEKTKTAP
ncbi:MAG: hypothetical protein KC503_33770 [Myxococcales bacterium]|nr:hypothetical protein [Myxococcales bacterium]